MTPILCSSCLAGMSGTVANPAYGDIFPDFAAFKITGIVYDRWDGNGRPHRANLCEGHLEILLQDGMDLRSQRPVRQQLTETELGAWVERQCAAHFPWIEE